MIDFGNTSHPLAVSAGPAASVIASTLARRLFSSPTLEAPVNLSFVLTLGDVDLGPPSSELVFLTKVMRFRAQLSSRGDGAFIFQCVVSVSS